ncbi:hypothetical protein VPH35_043666 [Triticum aestivum]
MSSAMDGLLQLTPSPRRGPAPFVAISVRSGDSLRPGLVLAFRSPLHRRPPKQQQQQEASMAPLHLELPCRHGRRGVFLRPGAPSSMPSSPSPDARDLLCTPSTVAPSPACCRVVLYIELQRASRPCLAWSAPPL